MKDVYSFRINAEMMRIKTHSNVLNILLQECYARPHHRCYTQNRAHASGKDQPTNGQEVEEVAVIGGGITGLASAFYISKMFKNVPITLYEAGSRLGGWLRSTSVDVGNGNVVFEQGPRTLRPNTPNGLVTLDLVSFRCPEFHDMLIRCCRSIGLACRRIS